MKYKVTLKANLRRGTLYWVAEINAGSESEAITAAEHLFEAQTESPEEWAFDEVDVEAASGR